MDYINGDGTVFTLARYNNGLITQVKGGYTEFFFFFFADTEMRPSLLIFLLFLVSLDRLISEKK